MLGADLGFELGLELVSIDDGTALGKRPVLKYTPWHREREEVGAKS